MIEVEGLQFGYGRHDVVVDDLDATFRPGTTSALVGRSGSGKSTLLYLLGLMLTARAGSIRLAGRETVGLPDAARAELRAGLVGFVFQDALLDPARTVLDNVLEGALYDHRLDRPTARRRALDLLEAFEVEVDPHRRPGQISGGQAQRVALARAFVRRPAVVLADEPTGNLDEQTADVVWDALAAHARAGATVVVATHDRDRATACDHVLLVGHGAAT